MNDPRTPERVAHTTNGYLMAALGLALIVLPPLLLVAGIGRHPVGVAVTVFFVVSGLVLLAGLYMLQPNEAAILTLFGEYTGTDRQEGLRWANPLAGKRKLSLRARNLNAPTLKVNDKRGNPVEIGAVVVWRVQHTAQAVFDVDDFETYVKVQAEAAIRHLASMYAYDDGEDLASGEHTLRGGMEAVSLALRHELQARFEAAGVQVQDAKLSHLAYAPEIAQVMLRRQQAEAIVSARHKIVEGAVGMVEAALNGLAARNLMQLDDERRAAMVSNLLVVLWLLWIVLPGTAALTWWLAGAVQADPQAQLAVAAVAASELLVLAGLGRFVVRVEGDTLHWGFGYLGWPHWQMPLADIRSVEQARTSWVEGWGIRRTKEGMLYNARSGSAVRLTLKDGRRLRLGSDEPDRLAAFIAARLR